MASVLTEEEYNEIEQEFQDYIESDETKVLTRFTEFYKNAKEVYNTLDEAVWWDEDGYMTMGNSVQSISYMDNKTDTDISPTSLTRSLNVLKYLGLIDEDEKLGSTETKWDLSDVYIGEVEKYCKAALEIGEEIREENKAPLTD